MKGLTMTDAKPENLRDNTLPVWARVEMKRKEVEKFIRKRYEEPRVMPTPAQWLAVMVIFLNYVWCVAYIR